eukprot:6490623-Amphidinium_carterae.2
MSSLDASGYSQVLLQDAFKLVRQAAFTTNVVEQGHASLTLMRRAHIMTEPSVLACRALLHHARSLFSPTDEEKRLSKYMLKLQELQHKQPQKVNARHMYLRDVMHSAAEESRKLGGPLSVAMRRCIFSEHARRYQNLPLDMKVHYEDAALVEQGKQFTDLKEDIEHMEAHLRLQRSRTIGKEQLCQLVKLSSCKWTSEQVQAFLQLGKALNLIGHKLNAARKESFDARDPPSDGMLARMHQFQPPPRTVRDVPPWMHHVCRLREITTGAVLSIVTEDDHAYYWILYSLLSPMTLCLKPLLRCDNTLPDLSRGMPAQEMLQACNSQPPNSFSMEPDFVVMPAARIEQVLEVHILMDVAFNKDNVLQSWGTWQSIETLWEASGPTTATRAHTRSTPSARSSIPIADLQQYPWLEQYMQNEPETTVPEAKRVRRVIPEHADEDALQKVVF